MHLYNNLFKYSETIFKYVFDFHIKNCTGNSEFDFFYNFEDLKSFIEKEFTRESFINIYACKVNNTIIN